MHEGVQVELLESRLVRVITQRCESFLLGRITNIPSQFQAYGQFQSQHSTLGSLLSGIPNLEDGHGEE